MKSYHRKRLLRLAAHLRTVEPSKFNMGRFGPTGCAAGHAATIFRSLGYRCESIPTYRGLRGPDAIKEFFGLDSEGYHALFGSINHPSTPKQVAKRMERFVDKSS